MSMCVSGPKQLYMHTPPSFPSERAPPFGATFVKVFLHPGSAPRLILITEEKMGQGTKPAFCGAVDEELCDSDFFSSDSSSGGSLGSSSSDLTDDAASSPSGGPLYELSSLMAQLPIKRGLSSFFSGKSQSFTSLSNVRCAEDLAKKEAPYRRKMKPCKSYGGMLDLSNNRSCFAPGPYGRTISKKSSRVSCASLAAKRSSSGLFGSPKPPPVPVQKNM